MKTKMVFLGTLIFACLLLTNLVAQTESGAPKQSGFSPCPNAGLFIQMSGVAQPSIGLSGGIEAMPLPWLYYDAELQALLSLGSSDQAMGFAMILEAVAGIPLYLGIHSRPIRVVTGSSSTHTFYYTTTITGQVYLIPVLGLRPILLHSVLPSGPSTSILGAIGRDYNYEAGIRLLNHVDRRGTGRFAGNDGIELTYRGLASLRPDASWAVAPGAIALKATAIVAPLQELSLFAVCGLPLPDQAWSSAYLSGGFGYDFRW